MHISITISGIFIVTSYDVCEKTAFGHVRTVKPWNRCTKLDIFRAMVRLEGSAARDGKISSPPASVEDRKPRFSAIGSRSSNIRVSRNVQFPLAKSGWIPLIAASCSSVSNTYHLCTKVALKSIQHNIEY